MPPHRASMLLPFAGNLRAAIPELVSVLLTAERRHHVAARAQFRMNWDSWKIWRSWKRVP